MFSYETIQTEMCPVCNSSSIWGVGEGQIIHSRLKGLLLWRLLFLDQKRATLLCQQLTSNKFHRTQKEDPV